MPRLSATYKKLVLDRPWVTLAVIALVVAIFAAFTPRFRLDASADSLVLENDQDLRYYRGIRARYGSDDYLIVTYTPDGDLFADETLEDLRQLRDGLAALDGVEDVTSILDVPLIRSPPRPLTELDAEPITLESAHVDKALAREELLTSPLYRDRLIGAEGRTTAIRVDMREDEVHARLLDERERLREKMLASELTAVEQARLETVTEEYKEYSFRLQERQQQDIAAVRVVLDKHVDKAELHLGGVPMIVADSIMFIRRDLIVFGLAVTVFLIIILAVAFRKPRWVLLPMLTCIATGVTVIGILGALDWRVTVVSSNFVSLLLILTLSLTLHLIVRYRELHSLNADAGREELVADTVQSKFVPSLYTALTTMIAFGSLVVSDIRPVIDFGWMMVLGLCIAFLMAFTLFPAGMLLLPPGEPISRRDLTARITSVCAETVQHRPTAILLTFGILTVVGAIGMTRLTVENRFIDYYRESTEIYRGMERIDRELGGTTPLEVILDAPAGEAEDTGLVDDALPEEFGVGEAEAGITARSHWLNSRRLPQVYRIHDYLDSLPETGKVVSLATGMRVLEQVDPQVVRDDFLLSIVYRRLSGEVRAALFDPYMSTDGDQLRFAIRVFESDPGLRRTELIAKIHRDLTEGFAVAAEQINLTGMMVLYNNMLLSLFRSQILTLGAVFLAIMLMFIVLFRSLRIAVLATLSNAVAAVFVLGLMGWVGIPLDLMTITIAAITVGIGVDDTIHYVHRFREEFEVDQDHRAAIARSHGSIGRAMYYTTVTIALGFAILVLSNFVPTVYFGLLTGTAMLAALAADLTLLPVLLMIFHVGRRGPSATPGAG
jgi:predicted RND superfamily exporter protein